jgi:protein involved in polysaccharide export with SLBB domain
VQVSVWGTIPRPGIYEIPDTTDLNKLLTMAGGAPLGPLQEDRDPPKITVRVYRPQKGEEEKAKIFESKLDRMLQGTATYPALRDNDIVVVETVNPDKPFGWRDILSVASTLGTLTLLALRIFVRV